MKTLYFDLSEPAYWRLRLTAEDRGVSVGEQLRRALNIEDHLRTERNQGSKVFVEVDGCRRELLV